MRTGPLLALTVAVVLAGCLSPVGVPSPDVGDAPLPDVDDAPMPDDGEQTADGGTATSPDATARNPWGDRTVVGIASETETGRDYAPLVRAAADYWEANAERYAGFPVEYEVDPDAASPDIVVRFVARVPHCDGSTDAVGCAPRVTDPRQIDRPETVWIKDGLSDESTTLVIKHEFGHTLGLGHEDEPADVMAARSVLYTEPKPDAVDRDFPWNDSSFRVYVDTANVSDTTGVDRQVGHALRYYADGAPGMPDNLTFRRVDDPARAEVVVRFSGRSPCGSGPGSCIRTVGPDPDGDGTIERYGQVTVVLVDLDTAAVGWHVGYWLAHALGTEADAEKPPPFRNATYRERRSAWWE